MNGQLLSRPKRPFTVMSSTHFIAVSSGKRETVSVVSKTGRLLVYASLLFNIVLCFINTQHWFHVGTIFVSISELLIVVGGLYLIRTQLSRRIIEIFCLLSLYLIALKFINPDLDLKILIDLSIPYIFYKIGTLSSIEQANRTLWTVMIIVLAVGSFELLLPTQFGDVFDVWSYYVDKGGIGQDVVDYSHTNLFVSGFRGSVEARMFFPGLLGAHRVSSVFLEPVSMGNFATIVIAWCLSISGPVRGRQFLLAFMAFVCIVVTDSRFAVGCSLIMLTCRFLPVIRSRFLLFFLPILTILTLTVVGSFKELPGVLPSIMADNFPGRLLFSARLLNYWNVSQWFALVPSQVYTADTGYAYVVNNLGLPVAVLLQGAFAAHIVQKREADILKFMIGVYFATSLCVGESIFSIKTAALLWFLFGATNAITGAEKTAPAHRANWPFIHGMRPTAQERSL
ncbi:MAG: polysaccharide polymerase [Acidocella sp.]|nr:polysaccharide polymerase [Acidocella sp.]